MATLPTANADYDGYLGMREELLGVKPAEFGWKPSKGKHEAFGIIMDWNRGDSIVTVSVFQTGDVSVYYSSGKLHLAGINIERFRQMATGLVKASQPLLAMAKPATGTELPPAGVVWFYAITNRGLFRFDENVAALTSDGSEWSDVFIQGNKIAEAYWEAIENK